VFGGTGAHNISAPVDYALQKYDWGPVGFPTNPIHSTALNGTGRFFPIFYLIWEVPSRPGKTETNRPVGFRMDRRIGGREVATTKTDWSCTTSHKGERGKRKGE